MLPRFLSLELHSANSCVGSSFVPSGLCIGNFVLHMQKFFGCGGLRFRNRSREVGVWKFYDKLLILFKNLPSATALPWIFSPLIKFTLPLSKKASSFSTVFSSPNSAPSFSPVQLNSRFYKRKSSNSLFVQWRWDSEIMEAFAEHDFRPKRLIGMVYTMELEDFLL